MIEAGKKLRDIDKPYYRYWQALFYSFFDSRLYVDVAKRWKGLGLLYFLLVLLIVCLPFSLRVSSEYSDFFYKEIADPMMRLPTLYLQNGKISVDKPMPYFIKNQENKIVAIVDTSGAITKIDDRYPDLSILITKDKIYYRQRIPHFFFSSENAPNLWSNVEVFPLGKSGNAVFDIKQWMKSSGILTIKTFFNILIYPTIVSLSFGLFFVVIMVIALMGQFIAYLFFRTSISYQQSCRLLSVSMTPFMVLLWVLLTLGILLANYSVFLLLLLFIYFCYAVLAVKRDSKKLVH